MLTCVLLHDFITVQCVLHNAHLVNVVGHMGFPCNRTCAYCAVFVLHTAELENSIVACYSKHDPVFTEKKEQISQSH